MGNKYINPLSDGGFKLFFGKEGKSNQFLIDFLNGLFAGDPQFDNDLKPVVGIFVLETHLPGKPERPVLDYQYRDREDPSEKLDMTRKIFVQLDYFTQKEDECINKKDQWLFILKHLDDMEYMPFTQTRDSIFAKLDKYAQIVNLSEEDLKEYERMLKFSLDYHTDMEDSRAEGRAEGILATAKNLKALGLDAASIAKATGLSEAEILKL